MSKTDRIALKLEHVFEVIGRRLAPHHPGALPALSALHQARSKEMDALAFDSFTSTLYNWIRWLDHHESTASPLSLAGLKAYVAELEVRRLQPTSIARYLVNLQRVVQAVSPDAHDVDAFLTGLLRTKRHGATARQWFRHRTAVLTREHLLALERAAGRASIKDARTLAVAWMMFDTLLAPSRLFGETKPTRCTPPLQRNALQVGSGRARLLVPACDTHNAAGRPLGAQCLQWLARYHQLSPPNVWMFTNRAHRPLQAGTWLTDLWALMHDAGLGELRVGVESCRRGAAKELFERGVPAEDICRLANWSSPLPLQRLNSLDAPMTAMRAAPPRRPGVDVTTLRAYKRGGQPPRVHRHWHRLTEPVPVTGDLFDTPR